MAQQPIRRSTDRQKRNTKPIQRGYENSRRSRQEMTPRYAAARRRQTTASAAVQKKRGHRNLPKMLILLGVVILIVVVIWKAASRTAKPEAPQTGTEATEHISATEPETKETIDRDQVVVGTDVLARYSTANYGNYNRTVNLELACKAVNGTMLLPDEIFSFNEIVGERTEEKGYLPASIYVSGDVQDEIGGGICQVASTIYLVAMKSDMEIVERYSHQFAVNYIPLGMDASIYWGSEDLKFKNTSGNPIRIYADTTGGCVNISIVGTKKDTNYIMMEYEVLDTYEPKETEKIDWTQESDYSEVTITPITGYYVQTYRCLYSADGTLISRTKEKASSYNKRDKVTTIGPPQETEATTEATTATSETESTIQYDPEVPDT